MMEKSDEITRAQSFLDAVKLINDNLTLVNRKFTSDYLAGQLAFERAKSSVAKVINENELMNHLRLIRDFGGKFNRFRAINVALMFASEHTRNK